MQFLKKSYVCIVISCLAPTLSWIVWTVFNLQLKNRRKLVTVKYLGAKCNLKVLETMVVTSLELASEVTQELHQWPKKEVRSATSSWARKSSVFAWTLCATTWDISTVYILFSIFLLFNFFEICLYFDNNSVCLKFALNLEKCFNTKTGIIEITSVPVLITKGYCTVQSKFCIKLNLILKGHCFVRTIGQVMLIYVHSCKAFFFQIMS